jgi:putative protease
MEEKRQGEYLPVFEDERGTYVMSSRDLCMIDHLPLLEAGIDSLNRGKDEGDKLRCRCCELLRLLML